MGSLVMLGTTFLVCLLGMPLQAAVSAEGLNGLTVSVDSNGAYDIVLATPAWHFGGDIGSPLRNLAQADGSDALGPYSEVAFDYTADAPRHASIRAYAGRQAGSPPSSIWRQRPTLRRSPC